MKPQDFIHELNRMCTYYKGQCEPNHCELDDIGCYINNKTKDEDFAKMYDTVAVWSDAHPEKTSKKTRQDVFLKLFPYASVRNGVISMCPKFYCLTCLGTDFTTCEPTKCNKCLRDYWLSPIDENEEAK